MNFSKNELNDTIGEYEAAKEEKKKLEKNFNKISLRNEKLLRDHRREKEIAQNKFSRTSGELVEKEKENDLVEIDIKKNKKILEKMLSRIGNSIVKIEFN